MRPHHRRILLSALGAGAVVALALRRSLVEVRGASMEPTLWPGDRLVTVPAVDAWLRPGQIVVLDDPEDPSHRIIKRIVAIDDGARDGGRDGGRAGDPGGGRAVRSIDVRGDDPRRSTDGRRWGGVPASSVRRIAVTRWPEVRSPLRRHPDPR